MSSKNRLWEFLATHHKLYEIIYAFHKESVANGVISRGHSIEHDLAVAAHALAIGDSLKSKKLGDMAAAAALMHSYDRFGQSAGTVSHWSLSLLDIYTLAETASITNAVIHHDVPNDQKTDRSDAVIIDVLADSDKLACLMLYNPVRSGQFDYQLPTLDLDHLHEMTPGANYKKHNCAWDDLYAMLEWDDNIERWFKTPYAQKLGARYGTLLRNWLEVSITQFESLGLDECPEPGLI